MEEPAETGDWNLGAGGFAPLNIECLEFVESLLPRRRFWTLVTGYADSWKPGGWKFGGSGLLGWERSGRTKN